MPGKKKNAKSEYFRQFVKALLSHYGFLMLFIILLAPLTISYSDESVTLTVNNKTGHYLHIIIDDDPYLYVQPENNIIYESDKYVELDIKAFYSPGQGISGSIDTVISIKPYKAESTGCSDNNNSSSGGCECSTTPASGGSKTWDVNVSDLQ
jgi:hypothetical protein